MTANMVGNPTGARNAANGSTGLSEYWWATATKRKRLIEKGIRCSLEKRKKLRDERNGTSPNNLNASEENQRRSEHEYEELETDEEDSPRYWVTVISSFSGEKIALLDMGGDLDENDITVEMVAYELEQWGERTLQKRSKGYLEEGFSFLRNSKLATTTLHPKTRLKDLEEGYQITLRVIIKWVDEHKSKAECLHFEHRHQAAVTAVNESEELKKLAKENIASPSQSTIGPDGLCRTCGSTQPSSPIKCAGQYCNCGDLYCTRCNRANRWNLGEESCSRCFPLVKKVVLDYFDKNNISEWAD